MSDQTSLFDTSEGPTAQDPKILKWRRNGDAFEGLVGQEIGQTLVARWVPALPVPDMGLVFTAYPEAEAAQLDAAEEERTRNAITVLFKQYGQYHEVVDETDVARVEIIGRAGRDAAKALGKAIGTSAVRQKDGYVRVCLWLCDDDAYDD